MSDVLNLSTVDYVPASARPQVLRPRAGIVHIGLGAFHRAHQAVFTEEAMAAGGGDWGIVAVAPRSAEIVRTLADQDGLFSVTTLAPADHRVRVVGSVCGVRHLPTEGEEILALLADPAVRVVTLTVTEKAYLLDPTTGRLRDDPQLRADLTTARTPRTVPGLLARALRVRGAAGGPPLAIVSCDNLTANGTAVRGAVEQALGEPAGAWVSFPSTMVDRIVPAATAQTRDRARAALGRADHAAVAAEPYRQWVLEDEFPGGRPAWDLAGATFSSDVTAYERLKLRALNGVHSTLAYLGALAGCETIDAALRLPGMPAFLGQLLSVDIEPTLSPPDGVCFAEYAAGVLDRFANPEIGHRTRQIAMDGSQKLPQRIFATIVDGRRAGAEPARLALAVAAWIRFLAGVRDDGGPLELDDPLAAPLRAALATAPDDAGTVRAVFALTAVVPPELAGDAVMIGLVADGLGRLRRDGVAATIAAIGR